MQRSREKSRTENRDMKTRHWSRILGLEDGKEGSKAWIWELKTESGRLVDWKGKWILKLLKGGDIKTVWIMVISAWIEVSAGVSRTFFYYWKETGMCDTTETARKRAWWSTQLEKSPLTWPSWVLIPIGYISPFSSFAKVEVIQSSTQQY